MKINSGILKKINLFLALVVAYIMTEMLPKIIHGPK